ncbi:MAG: hypothetical protein AAFP20_24875, partial [Cyanobacteria bacterium J06614_10]
MRLPYIIVMKSKYLVFLVLFLSTNNDFLNAQCNDVDIQEGLIIYNGNQHDLLKSVGQFQGSSSCTATF